MRLSFSSKKDSVIDDMHRHLGIVGKNGHVASFDWQTGTMHAELQLRETCRDFTLSRSSNYIHKII